jgi:hypothetical protein
MLEDDLFAQRVQRAQEQQQELFNPRLQRELAELEIGII